MSLAHRELAKGVDGRFTPFLDQLELAPGRYRIAPTGGVRTDADQALLYAKGRTVPGEPPFTPSKPLGQVVTNAQDGRSSEHHESHRAALDVWCLDQVTGALLPYGHSAWAALVAIAATHGLKNLGTDPQLHDWPHFSVPEGLHNIPQHPLEGEAVDPIEPPSSSDAGTGGRTGFLIALVVAGVASLVALFLAFRKKG